MSHFVKTWILIKKFITRTSEDQIGVYSAQASFFLLLSIFPIIMILFSMISLFNIPKEALIEVLNQLTPSTLSPLVSQMLDEILSKSSSVLLSVTGVMAVWSASKAVYALSIGLYNVYRIPDKRNYLIARIGAIFYTLLLLIAIVLTLALLVFGNTIYLFASKHFPFISHTLNLFLGNRTLICLCLLTLLFLGLFSTVRNSGYRIRDLVPGALFSSIGWLVFSYGFSIFVDSSGNYSYIYGSITMIILSMLWMYFCMFILFLGAEINVLFRDKMKRYSRFREYRRMIKKED